MTKTGKSFWTKAALLLVVVFVFGCFGCSSDDPPQVKTGTFVDSTVEGLQYKTETMEGITDSKGTFQYVEGETITFFVGGIIFGTAKANSVMTPVDLVEGATDETDPEVTNICRILHTLDDNHNAEDGIEITETVRNLAMDFSIDFGLSIVDFGNDATVQEAVATLTSVTSMGQRSLALAVTVQAHLRVTLQNLEGDVDDTDADGDGYTVAQGDCNDDDATIYPGAEEVCGDGIDQDCNDVDLSCATELCEGSWTGVTDQGYEINFTVSDGQVSMVTTTLDYTDAYSDACVGSNTLSTGEDEFEISDNSFTISTNELEVFGTFTEEGACEGTWYYQNAECGGAGSGTWTATCNYDNTDEDADGFTTADGDCDDTDATVNPGAEDICGDGIDQDCDGADAECQTNDPDVDDDLDGLTDNEGDCDDNDASVFPGAEEICGDGIDQDCDGTDLICTGDDDDSDKKVTICHNGNTISVSINALDAHLDHGDTLGACEDQDQDNGDTNDDSDDDDDDDDDDSDDDDDDDDDDSDDDDGDDD